MWRLSGGVGSYTSLSWGQSSYTNSSKFPAFCLFSPLHLFIQLFIYIIWIHDSLYTLGYNNRLLCFSDCSSFGHGELYPLLCIPLTYFSHCEMVVMVVLSNVLFSGTRYSRLILYISCPSPQFSSVAQSCPPICNPMDCSTPGFPVLHQLLELAQISYPLSQWCHPTISSSVVPFFFCLQSFPASGSFPMSQYFASGSQSIGASASASVLPMNIQDWFPLGWTGWISLQSKDL